MTDYLTMKRDFRHEAEYSRARGYDIPSRNEENMYDDFNPDAASISFDLSGACTLGLLIAGGLIALAEYLPL
jgi:hypothetical protein